MVSAAAAVAGLGAVVTLTSTAEAVTDEVAGIAFGTHSPPPLPSTTSDTARCPWLERAMNRHTPAATLAADVVGRMTVREKLGEIVLVHAGPYENINAGVPSLCIPALSLQDGPQGVAYGAVGVTQLPAPLGIAATFDTGIAQDYGQVQGSEAAGQGIDVIQGPTLNIDRVPQSGRTYEGFGEDPLLVADMGVADAEGIQTTGTLAMAKHFAVYNQETDRGVLDTVVSQRALEELYFPPFKAAVTRAHVSTVMCAYPRLNGTYQCQDPALSGQLADWGFTGFIRSDLGSVHDPVVAIEAGTDLLKPSSVTSLDLLVRGHRLALAAVDRAVTRVLTQMFAHGLVDRPESGSPGTAVDSDSHTDFALVAAERSAVLLKDVGNILPLSASAHRSVAVIGADAGSRPVTSGYGSSRVTAPFVSSPLDAIRNRAGSHTTITYADGGSTTGNLPPVPAKFLVPASGVGHGLTLTLTLTQTDPDAMGLLSLQAVQRSVDISLGPHPSTSRLLPSAPPSSPVERLTNPLAAGIRPLSLGSAASPTHTHVVLPPGWSDVSASWTGTLTPPRSGLYTLSLQGSGAARLTLDGVAEVADPLSHALGRWAQTVHLTGGHAYRVDLAWEPVDQQTPSGESTISPSSLTLGWAYVSPKIDAAVAAARRADVAVVFAGDFNSEAFDRPSLNLPGDENALISAVAAANPRTVVVLDTGGPVLMPWLRRVKGVIEAWYPGEQDGVAIAALLYGDVDPAGRLPVTFPASDTLTAVAAPSQWPGVDLTSSYSEGLDVGYRYDHATGIQPLFPFGFGLSYTRFSIDRLAVARSATGYALRVRVANTGGRAGIAVPQAYLTFPTATGEPPAQLEAFAPVSLGPGQSRVVTLSVPASALRVYLGRAWTTVPGTYTFSVGPSSADLPLTASVNVP
ncbi:MAG TPA: glycoside hydrolase family 3 C-terminal domain-containing protein [Acidimicrobiales bacterium]